MRSFPFDNQSAEIQDRNVDSSIFADYLYRMIGTNGIFADIGTKCQVIAGTGMNIVVKPGEGIINGRFFVEDEERTLAIQASESADRIDTVVLRLSEENRNIDYYVLKGTAATSPTAPVLTRESGVYELGIADIFVPKLTTSIPQYRITDTRLNTERCGVAPVFGEIDTQGLYDQYQASLDNFLELVASALDETTAGNLQNQINLKVDKTDYTRAPGYATTTGTATGYIVTLTDVPTSYTDGMRITIVPHIVNEAGATLNVNSLGAVSLKTKENENIEAGKMLIDMPYEFIYRNGNFILLNEGGGKRIYGTAKIGYVKSKDKNNNFYSTNADINGTLIYIYDKNHTLTQTITPISSGRPTAIVFSPSKDGYISAYNTSNRTNWEVYNLDNTLLYSKKSLTISGGLILNNYIYIVSYYSSKARFEIYNLQGTNIYTVESGSTNSSSGVVYANSDIILYTVYSSSNTNYYLMLDIKTNEVLMQINSSNTTVTTTGTNPTYVLPTLLL